MKNESTQNGFTLIELLVVIGIVGVLATVMLAVLGTTRKQSIDTAIKQTLSGTKNQAELYYYNNANSYSNVCASGAVSLIGATRSIYLQVADAAKKAGIAIASVKVNPVGGGAYNQVTCNDSSAAWAAEVPLSTSKSGAPVMLCVDSAGKLKQESVVLGVGAVICQ
ncbi:MAG: type II secretion system protein [bacterium]